MAKKDTITIRGLPELQRKFNALSAAAKGSIISTALTAGALPIQTAAQANAAYLTGTLRRSIHTEVKTSGNKGTATVGTDLEYAAQREFGGTITAKNAPYLVFRVGGAWVKVRSVTQPARPYLRPAFEDNKGKAVDEIAAVFRAQIYSVAGR